ncbi:MAG: PaaI family thioesterase [Rubricoccaceae bacterium]
MSVPSSFSLDQIRESMSALGAAGLAIPPPSFTSMECEVVDYQPGAPDTNVGARMTVRIPVRKRWQNPMGLMQGGALAMAVDNVIGPLSYLVAPPSSTTQLALTYLAPVTPDMEDITAEGVFVHRAGRQLVFDAEVKGPDGTALTAARATCRVVRSAPKPDVA